MSGGVVVILTLIHILRRSGSFVNLYRDFISFKTSVIQQDTLWEMWILFLLCNCIIVL